MAAGHPLTQAVTAGVTVGHPLKQAGAAGGMAGHPLKQALSAGMLPLTQARDAPGGRMGLPSQDVLVTAWHPPKQALIVGVVGHPRR